LAHPVSLTRAQVRQLKKAVRHDCSADAAERLLADSVKKGHERLALHRYLALHVIDASRCEPFEDYCAAVARDVDLDAMQRILRHVGSNHGSGAASSSATSTRSGQGN